jgi:hypothetical protein
VPDWRLVTTLAKPWQVTFDSAPIPGGPKEPLTFTTLDDWSKRPEEEIRYFSGTAVYRQRFDLDDPAVLAGAARCEISLGVVHNSARVRLNGRDLGVAWCPPWRLDATGALLAKDNVLEIEVANLWQNRLVGDSLIPESERAARIPPTRVNNLSMGPFDRRPLLPSGLLGPVAIVVDQQTLPKTAK